MNNRITRYVVFAFTLSLLIFGNIVVHIIGMNLSENALSFEKQITALRQQNMQLETEIYRESSLQTIAAFAQSEGYVSSGPAVRFVEPVIASNTP
ncbi:MAG TPA: hypothetical protein PKG71_01465 [Candidatus Woesebacteria bacterium]|nr:hypothetical protein [Candidatus Woesebacteria bacterium]HNS94612.1 hypothetical protein [Candidatus Woesebacteria bacterium]